MFLAHQSVYITRGERLLFQPLSQQSNDVGCSPCSASHGCLVPKGDGVLVQRQGAPAGVWGLRRLEEAGGGWRRVEEDGEGWRMLEEALSQLNAVAVCLLSVVGGGGVHVLNATSSFFSSSPPSPPLLLLFLLCWLWPHASWQKGGG